MASIEKRGDSYRITVSGGYDITGKKQRTTMTWTPTPGMTKRQLEKELNRQATLFEEKVKTGQVIGGDIRFADFAERWFSDYGREHLKARTYTDYRHAMPRINAALGHMAVNKIKPNHVAQFCKNLGESGIREDTKYSPAVDFKTLLKQRQLSQSQLSDLAGVSHATVGGIVKGSRVSQPTAEKVSRALEMPLRDLFTPAAGSADTLTGQTVLKYYRVLSSILTTAVQWQLIPFNPCERVKPPKVEHKEANCLDEAATRELFRCLEQENTQHRAIVTLAVYSGMRRGELCGLTWQDVHFDTGLIDINKETIYIRGQGIRDDTPKNQTSRRVIKVSPDVLDVLRLHRTEQNRQRLQVGDQWTNSGKVFTRWNGSPVDPDAVSGWFHNFIQRNGLPPIRFHDLRHTNASLLIAAGTDIKTVSKRLGHSSVSTTGNIYTHAIKTADELAADTLHDILGQKRSGSKTG